MMKIMSGFGYDERNMDTQNPSKRKLSSLNSNPYFIHQINEINSIILPVPIFVSHWLTNKAN